MCDEGFGNFEETIKIEVTHQQCFSPGRLKMSNVI